MLNPESVDGNIDVRFPTILLQRAKTKSPSITKWMGFFLARQPNNIIRSVSNQAGHRPTLAHRRARKSSMIRLFARNPPFLVTE
jgi:hypothetical protein